MTIGKPFPKGQSGNPNGRPKKSLELKQLEAKAKEHGEDMIDILVQAARGKIKSKLRMDAAQAVLDRGYGKPKQKQEQEHSAKQGRTLKVTFKVDSTSSDHEEQERSAAD